MAEKEIVKRLREQVERLIADHTRMMGECRQLVAERDKLLADNRHLTEKVREQETRIRGMELTAGMCSSAGSVERARARVNSLLREVDKCIAQMTREQQDND